MIAGSSLLVWRVGTSWTWLLLALTSLLLVVVLVAPPFARGFMKVLGFLESSLVMAVSWLLLGAVFLLIFVPGRLLLFLTGDSRFGRQRAATYWQPIDARRMDGGFDRTF